MIGNMREVIELSGKDNKESLNIIVTKVLDVLKSGGLALIPDGVGYGLVGNSAESIRRIFDIKGRSLEKSLTHYMSVDYISNVAILDEKNTQLIDEITKRVPCCFAVPYNNNSPYFRSLDQFALKQSTKSNTVALFFEREDALIKNLLQLSLSQDFPLIVSSANLSCKGNNYRFEEVLEQGIPELVDICVYSKIPCKYESEASISDTKLGSTIIKLPEKQIIREGIFARQIKKFLGEYK